MMKKKQYMYLVRIYKNIKINKIMIKIQNNNKTIKLKSKKILQNNLLIKVILIIKLILTMTINLNQRYH